MGEGSEIRRWVFGNKCQLGVLSTLGAMHPHSKNKFKVLFSTLRITPDRSRKEGLKRVSPAQVGVK